MSSTIPVGARELLRHGPFLFFLLSRSLSRFASQIVAVENQLRRALGTKVVVHANGKGAGRIVIPFGSLDEFQRLLDHITE